MLFAGELEQLAEGLNREEERQMKRMIQRINTLVEYAEDRNVRVMIDAEQVCMVQPTIWYQYQTRVLLILCLAVGKCSLTMMTPKHLSKYSAFSCFPCEFLCITYVLGIHHIQLFRPVSPSDVLPTGHFSFGD